MEEKTRNVPNWIVAAGQVDISVVARVEKPNPFTIWLENYFAHHQTCSGHGAEVLPDWRKLTARVAPVVRQRRVAGSVPERRRDSHRGGKEKSRLGVLQCLPKLRLFLSIVGCHGLVLPHPFDSDSLLSLIEPSGIGLVVRHEVHHDQ